MKRRERGIKHCLAMAAVDVEVAVATGTLRFPCFWLADLYLVGTWLRGGRCCVGVVAHWQEPRWRREGWACGRGVRRVKRVIQTSTHLPPVVRVQVWARTHPQILPGVGKHFPHLPTSLFEPSALHYRSPSSYTRSSRSKPLTHSLRALSAFFDGRRWAEVEARVFWRMGVETGANGVVGSESRFFRVSRHRNRWRVSRSMQVVFLEWERGGRASKGNKVGGRDQRKTREACIDKVRAVVEHEHDKN